MTLRHIYIMMTVLLSMLACMESTAQTSSTATDTICKHPATLPQYYGGYDELLNYLYKNIRLPQDSSKGLVIAEFVIEKDGSTTNIKILRGGTEEMNNEVIRLLSNMPRWEPAYDEQNKPVRAKMAFPVEFRNTPHPPVKRKHKRK
ncbi:MAG: energy transducer TonB [Bacteroidales bacterium]|nr:energy transducer TonB [Bacteroidales bacterium]